MRTILAMLSLAVALAAQVPRAQLGPVSFGGEADLVWQGYPSFPAAYSGPLSLPAAGEFHNTRVFTLTTSTTLASGWRVETDIEAANGMALGGATGLAGITSLDVTRSLDPDLAPHVYLARLYLERAWAGGRLRIGRMDIADDVDANAVIGGNHHQFMNWSLNINPAWDYAADTRGYTNAVEWQSHDWLAAYALMPVAVNGMRLNWRSSQIDVQRTLHWRRLTLRPLAYVIHAPLGSYAPGVTDIDARHRWRWKPGAGLSADARLSSTLDFGFRLGLNNDNLEEYANTESGDSASIGLAWHRGANRVGLAAASNGLFAAHAAYLATGGDGFLLGDGGLSYARETIAETYWLRHLAGGVDWGPDLQYIRNPGYNRARGPVWVVGLRLHLEF